MGRMKRKVRLFNVAKNAADTEANDRNAALQKQLLYFIPANARTILSA